MIHFEFLDKEFCRGRTLYEIAGIAGSFQPGVGLKLLKDIALKRKQKW
jgi:hypothetical protein